MNEIGSADHLHWQFKFILEFNKLLHCRKNYGMLIDLMETTWKMYKLALKDLQEAESHWSWADTPAPHTLEVNECIKQ